MSEWIVKQNPDGQLEVVGELIRCKDCKYAYGGYHNYRCIRVFHEFVIELDGFCKWAERKEE